MLRRALGKLYGVQFKIGLLLVLRVLGALSGLVTSIILINFSIEIFTQFSIFLVIITLASTFAIYGMDIFLVREVSNPDPNIGLNSQGLQVFCQIFVLCLSIVVGVIVSYILPLIYHEVDAIPRHIVILCIILQSVSKVRVSILRNCEKYISAQLVEAGLQPALFLALVIVVWVFAIEPNRIFSLFLVTCALNAIFAVAATGLHLKFSVEEFIGKSRDLIYIIKESGIFLISTFSFILSNRVDLLLLVSVLNVSEFAVYRVAAQVFELSTIVSTTFLATYAAKIASFIGSGDQYQLKKFLSSGIKINFVIMFIAATLFTFMGSHICDIIFPSLSGVYIAISLFVWFRTLIMIAPAGSLLLDLSRNQQYPLLSNILLTVILSSIFILSNNFNLYVAVIVTGTMHCLRNGINEFVSWKKLKIIATVFSRS